MSDPFFISYSSVDGKEFALRLADDLSAGPPEMPVWVDQRRLRPGEDWDEQIAEALRTCKGLIFVMSQDSVRANSVCKDEWVRALKYKKPIIPLLLAREAELPLRLGSREYINFSSSYDSGLARLRKHLTWMDSPEGALQALKYRLLDAQRELPRADAEMQVRIREDISLLERQIASQQNIIANPEAVKQKVQERVDAVLETERKPEKPSSGIHQGRFINPPPLVAPTWFQDRHFESGQIGAFLKDEALRLVTVVGRGGVGKSAMVCRLLRSLEGGQLPDDAGALNVDGIVYLSAARSFHRPNLPDLYAGLVRLLPEETVKGLDAVYKNPQSSPRATMEALLQAFPSGRTVVLLDNFEDLLEVESGKITDNELDEALRALLELPPHGLKVIITTRQMPRELALIHPALQRRLDLDAGLGSPYAENILKAMDSDGKVGLRDASLALLDEARERTLGFPRALEHLFGILSADRDTSLEDILKHTRKYLPDQVMKVLVGEAFSRLDLTAQRAMQALAIYRYPVPPAAVDFLLQPYVPGIDSGLVLSRLVNMQFARRDTGRYYLHQVDRDYALSRILPGEAADRNAEPPPLTCFALWDRAAEWFKLARRPREDWKSLGDLAPQLSEFELRCQGEDYDTAALLLIDIDYDYLFVWGHYHLAIELHERITGKIQDQILQRTSLGNLGSGYNDLGQYEKALHLYEKAMELANQQNDRVGEIVWLSGVANCYADLGQFSRAIDTYEKVLQKYRENSDRNGEGFSLTNLGEILSHVGQIDKAIDYTREALQIFRELNKRAYEVVNLDNLGSFLFLRNQQDEARVCHQQALTLAKELGYRLIEASAHANLGNLAAIQGDWDHACNEFETAIEIYEDIGTPQHSNFNRIKRALHELMLDRLDAARELLLLNLKQPVLEESYASYTLLGIILMRLKDPNQARRSFTSTIEETSKLRATCAENFDALDEMALAHCGLALCGEPHHVGEAKTAFQAARRLISSPGATFFVQLKFDALVKADVGGLLSELQPFVARLQT